MERLNLHSGDNQQRNVTTSLQELKVKMNLNQMAQCAVRGIVNPGEHPLSPQKATLDITDLLDFLRLDTDPLEAMEANPLL